MTAKIETITITITLTREEAYALCNKLDDKALVTHGGYCEFDQIKLLQKVGKEIGTLVGHHAAKNDLTLDVKAAVYSANAGQHLSGDTGGPNSKKDVPAG